MDNDTLFGTQPKVTFTPDSSGGYVLRVEMPYGVNRAVGEIRGTIGNTFNVEVPMTFEMESGRTADSEFVTRMTRPKVRISGTWEGRAGNRYLQGGGTFNVEEPTCTFEQIGTCARKEVAFWFEAELPQTETAPPLSACGGSIRIQSVTGDAEVLRARRNAAGDIVWEQGEVLQEGAEICSNDRIVTGMDSTVTIIDSQGERVVKVGELTDTKPAEEFREDDGQVRTRLWLKAGEVSVEQKPNPKRSDFTIKTPILGARIKGTRLTVRHVEGDRPESAVAVTEGVVEVTPDNHNLYIMIVEAGEEVSAHKNGQSFGTSVDLVAQPAKQAVITTPNQPPTVKFTANPPQAPAQTTAPSQLPVVKFTAPRPSAPPHATSADVATAPNPAPSMDAVPPAGSLVEYLVLDGGSVRAELRRGDLARWTWTEGGAVYAFDEINRTATRLVIHDPTRDMYHRFFLDTGKSFWRVGTRGAWNPHYPIVAN